VEDDAEPATYTKAIASVDKDKWLGAMQEEMQSLENNGTWDVVRLPKQKKRLSAASGYLKERKVYLLMSLQGLRQG
jgi:hypothetical protein